ncbi:MAG: DinB family protein [Candidatus Promineifilaceae bacterium]
MSEILSEIFKHSRWANLGLVDFCARLDEALLAAEPLAGGVYGPVQSTLRHIANAERRYLGWLANRPYTYLTAEGQPEPDLETIRRSLAETGQEFVALAAEPPERQRARGLDPDDGEPYDVPASLLLVQAINHASEHRAQVMVVLTQHGVEPPELDGWTYGEA